MFGKLLKYEIKHSSRYVLSIYICAAAAAAFMLLGMLAKVTWISVLGSIVLYTVGFAVVIMTLVSVIKNFYDSLYGAQGYLSFTLPVKCSSLLFSKVVVSFFWIILSCVALALMFVLIFLNAKAQSGSSFTGIYDAMKISGILDMLPSGAMIVKFLIIMGVLALLNILVFVGFVYFAVTLANTRALQKHPKLFGFLIFAGTYGFSNSLSAKLTTSIPLSVEITTEKVSIVFSSMDSAGQALASFGIAGTIFMALVATGLLVATGWIMEHKVNIK
ncbi:MAG: hypothetical protein IJ262_01610 [Clostridia bacterium]|nr:hypothetical protein [Clostridia bacterium]